MIDSSALVAGMLSDHLHHSPANAWLSQAKAHAFEFAVSAHSLVEVYSVLTRIPRRPRISSAEAWRMLRENVTSCADVVALSDRDYVRLVEELRGALGVDLPKMLTDATSRDRD